VSFKINDEKPRKTIWIVCKGKKLMCSLEELIGEKDKFAIQYKILGVERPFILGHICYWIKGEPIGDFQSSTILSDVYVFLPRILYNNDNRQHEKLFKMKKEDVLYLLGGQAYLDDDKYEEQALIEMWSRFNIEIGLDVFKGTVVKLIENAKDARVIFFSNNGFLNELYLKKGIIDRVFEIFDEKLNLIYKEMDLE
jgi:hypothetical protein